MPPKGATDKKKPAKQKPVPPRPAAAESDVDDAGDDQTLPSPFEEPVYATSEIRQSNLTDLLQQLKTSKSITPLSEDEPRKTTAIGPSSLSAAKSGNRDVAKVTVQPRNDPASAQGAASFAPVSLGSFVQSDAPRPQSGAPGDGDHHMNEGHGADEIQTEQPVGNTESDHPRFNQRMANPTVGMMASLTEADKSALEFVQTNKPQQSLRTLAQQHQTDTDMPQEVVWENTNLLTFLPRSMGFHVSAEIGRLPTVDAPDLPHAPRYPVKPKFQAPVGFTTGDRGDYLAKKDKRGVQEIVDRRGLEAFMRMTSRNPGYEFCDSTGQHMNDKMIWLDHDKRTTTQQLALAKTLVEDYQRWYAKYEQWGEDMRAWRIQRREAEFRLWRHQVDSRNWDIFIPALNVPENWQTYNDGLRSFIDTENQKDRDREYPNAYQGRPPRRRLNISLEEVAAIEKEYGAANPPHGFADDLEAQSERLGMYNRHQPLDRRGNRLWKMGARIVQRKRGEEELAWEVSGRVGLRPHDAPPGLTDAQKVEWAIREDERWNQDVFEEIRKILAKRGAKLAKDDVPCDERPRHVARTRRTAQAAPDDQEPEDDDGTSSEDEKQKKVKPKRGGNSGTAGKGRKKDSDDDDLNEQGDGVTKGKKPTKTPQKRKRETEIGSSTKKPRTGSGKTKGPTTKANRKQAETRGKERKESLDGLFDTIVSKAERPQKNRRPDNGEVQEDEDIDFDQDGEATAPLIYVPDLEGPSAAECLDVFAPKRLTLLKIEMSDEEWMSGFRPDQNKALEELRESAIRWVNDRDFDEKTMRAYGISYQVENGRPKVAKNEFTIEQGVKWAPVKLIDSHPCGSTEEDGWKHTFQLEINHNRDFTIKRIEAAFLQHSNSSIEALPAPKATPDFRSCLRNVNQWFNRDDVARKEGINMRDPNAYEAIREFWDDHIVNSMLKIARVSTSEDVAEWLRKGAPKERNLRPGSRALKAYRSPRGENDDEEEEDEEESTHGSTKQAPIFYISSAEEGEGSDTTNEGTDVEPDDEDDMLDEFEIPQSTGQAVRAKDGSLGEQVYHSISPKLRPPPGIVFPQTPELQQKLSPPPFSMKSRRTRLLSPSQLMRESPTHTKPATDGLPSGQLRGGLGASKIPVVVRKEDSTRGRSASFTPARTRGQEIKQMVWGSPSVGGTPARTASPSTQVSRQMIVSRELPEFNSTEWHAYPQFTLRSDFPSVFGLVRPVDDPEEFAKHKARKPALVKLWRNREGQLFFELEEKIDPYRSNRQILVALYPDQPTLQRYSMIYVDLDRNFDTKSVLSRWDSHGMEIGPVFDQYQVRIPRAHDSYAPLDNQQTILEMVTWNEEDKCWRSEGRDFKAVGTSDLGEPTGEILLVPIRKGLCVKTAVHELAYGDTDNVLCFDLEARYPWDYRRILRLQPCDELGEHIDSATVARPKNIPLRRPDGIDARSSTRTTFRTARSHQASKDGSSLAHSIERD